MQDPTPCLLYFSQYTKHIRFYVLQVLSLQILNLVPIAKYTKMFSEEQNYHKSRTYVRISCNRDLFDLKDLLLCYWDLPVQPILEVFCSFISNNKRIRWK